jgi:membrane protein implicated in regulation of membrane protease activity
MEDWVLWLIASIALGAGEMMTMGFFLAPFAIGAGVAALAALIGGGAVVSTIVFAVVATTAFAAVRPIARRHTRMPPQIRTGTAALIGRPAMVLERIANDEGVGCVKIEGEIWTARSYDDDRVIEAGTRVQVIEIRGATALVSD